MQGIDLASFKLLYSKIDGFILSSLYKSEVRIYKGEICDVPVRLAEGWFFDELTQENPICGDMVTQLGYDALGLRNVWFLLSIPCNEYEVPHTTDLVRDVQGVSPLVQFRGSDMRDCVMAITYTNLLLNLLRSNKLNSLAIFDIHTILIPVIVNSEADKLLECEKCEKLGTVSTHEALFNVYNFYIKGEY